MNKIINSNNTNINITTTANPTSTINNNNHIRHKKETAASIAIEQHERDLNDLNGNSSISGVDDLDMMDSGDDEIDVGTNLDSNMLINSSYHHHHNHNHHHQNSSSSSTTSSSNNSTINITSNQNNTTPQHTTLSLAGLSEADRKRAHHNALERKRRDHIKDSFHTLRDAIPNIKGEKTSRAQILKAATEYIKIMRGRNMEFQCDIDTLRKQNSEIETQIDQLEKIKLSSPDGFFCEPVDDEEEILDELLNGNDLNELNDQSDPNSFNNERTDETDFKLELLNENEHNFGKSDLIIKNGLSGLIVSASSSSSPNITKKFKTIVKQNNF